MTITLDPFSFLNSDKPRALTEDEVRDLFLKTVARLSHHWATTTLEDDSVSSRCDGLAFSILALLDGSNIGLPGMKVIPNPAPEDEEYLKNDGKNWFPDNVDIGGGLHELIHQHLRTERENMGEYARKLRARTLGKAEPTVTQEAPKDAPKALTNREFHQQRRMFCVINGVPHVAEVGDTRYHRQWMDGLVESGFLEERTYTQSPRGFYLAPEMVWYRGPMHPVGMSSINESLAALATMMELPPETEVYNGARTGPDDVFKGAAMVGTIQDILENI